MCRSRRKTALFSLPRPDGWRTIGAALPCRPALSEVFASLFPAAMYLKWAFGKAAWHQERNRACLIVDDPLLKNGYGFLNFQRLAGLMDAFDFTTSVGFIPWNFRRTDRKTAEFFKNMQDRLSLCVHGCDHTHGEFGLCDRSGLDFMVKKATDRMNRHERSTGLSFDRVMVFPQGVFSVPAMETLKSNNYIAAINFDVLPVDFQDSIKMQNFLEPAMSVFGDFPLFLRRCPEELSEIASDLFWGSPALIMAHHDFFKDHRRVIDAIRKINAIEGGVEWDSPGEIVRKSHLSKEGPENTTLVKGYVSEMVIDNPTPFEMTYIVTKNEASVCSP